MARFSYSPRIDTGLVVELALPVVPVLPELVALVPLALPDWAAEVVTGLALAEPVVPPFPEFPEVGLEFTVAGPVLPVAPVLPEFPEVADELYSQESAMHGETSMALPVVPEFPELPEFPEVAELSSLVAVPVFPELALPDSAVVDDDDDDVALPLWPPWADPVAVLAPELPDWATGEPLALELPELPDPSLH